MEKAGADQKEKAPDKNTATPVYRGKPGTVRKDRPEMENEIRNILNL